MTCIADFVLKGRGTVPAKCFRLCPRMMSTGHAQVREVQAYISKSDAEGSPWLTAKGGELAPASDAIRQAAKVELEACAVLRVWLSLSKI